MNNKKRKTDCSIARAKRFGEYVRRKVCEHKLSICDFESRAKISQGSIQSYKTGREPSFFNFLKVIDWIARYENRNEDDVFMEAIKAMRGRDESIII